MLSCDFIVLARILMIFECFIFFAYFLQQQQDDNMNANELGIEEEPDESVITFRNQSDGMVSNYHNKNFRLLLNG